MKKYLRRTAIFLILFVVIVGIGWWFVQPLLFDRVDASVALLAEPSSYRPAAIAMARLCDTDPKLRAADANGLPPNWTPPEIGRLGPLTLSVDSDQASMSTTAGLAEFNGYSVERDREKSTATTDVWYFSTGGMGPLSDVPPYSFALPKNDGYTETELVKNGLTELARRIAARAAGTDPAVAYGMSDPVADRTRLLAQHPVAATQLGVVPPSTTTTTRVATTRTRQPPSN